MPRKLFDAMAMAKPIVATNISDLRQTLSGCGWIVEPSDLLQLTRAIENILTHPEEAQEKGKKAREKCVRDFSLDAVGRKLISITKNLTEIYQIRGE